MDDTLPFRIQGDWDATTHAQQTATTIPWWLAEVAYEYYAELFGTAQSLEQLNARGGFCRTERVALLRRDNSEATQR